MLLSKEELIKILIKILKKLEIIEKTENIIDFKKKDEYKTLKSIRELLKKKRRIRFFRNR